MIFNCINFLYDNIIFLRSTDVKFINVFPDPLPVHKNGIICKDTLNVISPFLNKIKNHI